MPNYSLNLAINDDAYFACALDGDVTMWLYSTIWNTAFNIIKTPTQLKFSRNTNRLHSITKKLIVQTTPGSLKIEIILKIWYENTSKCTSTICVYFLWIKRYKYGK